METTELMIEEIVDAIAGPMATRRQTHYLRESLRHLVRAAKSEQARDVKRCIALSVGVTASTNSWNSKIAAKKFMATLLSRQGKLDSELRAPE